MKSKRYILIIFILFAFYHGYCQIHYKSGRPFIKDYSDELLANDQIWSIVQDKRGIMYFGATSGIIEFDGSKWQLIEVSNNSGVRSIDIDSIGTIYVGATGEFGYLACDTLGHTKYYSLKIKPDSIYSEFTDVWLVKATKTGVYFVTRKMVFRWHNNEISVIKSKLEKYNGANAGENLMIINRKNGISIAVNDTLKDLPFTKHLFPEKGLFAIYPFVNNKIIIATEEKFYEYNFDLIDHYSEKYADEIDSTLFIQEFETDFMSFLQKVGIYSYLRINDNLYAIGTLRGGVIFFDAFGKFVALLNKNNGLPDNAILSLYIDNFQDLWIGTNNGISRVEINSPLTYFDDKDGIEGSVFTSVDYKGNKYVGSLYGIYLLEDKIENGIKTRTFKSISINKSSCWDFIKHDGILFASGDDGVEIITGNSVKEVIKTDKILCFGKSFKFPNTIFMGMFDSFGYFQIETNKKGKHSFINYTKLDGINETIRIITSDNEGGLWITSEYNGIYNIVFEDNLLEKYNVTNYDTTDGLPQMDFNYVFNMYNKIYVGTAEGLYKIVENKDLNKKHYTIIPDTTFGKVFSDKENSIGNFEIDNTGNIWINAELGLGPVIKAEDGIYVWDTIPYKRIDAFNIEFDELNNLWAYNSKGLLMYGLDKKYDFAAPYNALIRKVISGKDSVLLHDSYYDENTKYEFNNFLPGITQPESLKPIIKYKNNSLTFYFTAAFYIEYKEIRFNYMLKGFDDEWSDWTSEKKKEYTNLPEGDYVFYVKAKNIYANYSREAAFEFVILPPWYRTIYAYFGYLVIIIIIFYLVLDINSRRLKAANIKLEKIVKERTAKIERQKEDILERNIEISIQKEEIELQTKQLEKTNIELEKLSIVASKTDNAVVIMDAEGKFKWINEGFTRMYGYTLEELIKERGDNIFETSTNAYVKDLIHTCVTNKETVIYESMIIPHEGNNIWAQTTLTPIVDESGKVTKLIAIDTDIGQIKTAEIEISNQKEELLAQSEMLADINTELERNNILITDSISYAKRIQEAILPTEKIIGKYFPESFIFFKPKDIVSGDFFWFLKPDTNEWGKTNNKIFIAAVDCTGHGVPGAFMSMIGNTLLNDIVGNDKIFKPAEILDKLNAGIIHLLKQREYHHDESQDDGMDITICKIDPDVGELEIALANHNVYIKEGDELKSIEGDIYSIGGFFAKRFKPKFTNHVIEIDENSILYMFSDGYKDQFGGENKQKFIETRFKKMIEDNMNLNMRKQQSIIENTFIEWKGENKQIDDVLVLGLKFSGLDDLY